MPDAIFLFLDDGDARRPRQRVLARQRRAYVSRGRGDRRLSSGTIFDAIERRRPTFAGEHWQIDDHLGSRRHRNRARRPQPELGDDPVPGRQASDVEQRPDRWPARCTNMDAAPTAIAHMLGRRRGARLTTTASLVRGMLGTPPGACRPERRARRPAHLPFDGDLRRRLRAPAIDATLEGPGIPTSALSSMRAERTAMSGLPRRSTDPRRWRQRLFLPDPRQPTRPRTSRRQPPTTPSRYLVPGRSGRAVGRHRDPRQQELGQRPEHRHPAARQRGRRRRLRVSTSPTERAFDAMSRPIDYSSFGEWWFLAASVDRRQQRRGSSPATRPGCCGSS